MERKVSLQTRSLTRQIYWKEVLEKENIEFKTKIFDITKTICYQFSIEEHKAKILFKKLNVPVESVVFDYTET